MSNIEQTLSIIKPDAVERNLDNEIKEMFKSNGFKIVNEKKIQIEKAEAEKLGVPFLNAIPLDITLRTTSDEGNPIVHKEPNNSISKKYMEIGSKILNQIQTNRKQPPQIIQ